MQAGPGLPASLSILTMICPLCSLILPLSAPNSTLTGPAQPAHGDVLRHRHLHASVDDLTDLQDAAAEGFGPCVWEFAVQGHERRAWLRHVLANLQGPDLDAYLEDRLAALV